MLGPTYRTVGPAAKPVTGVEFMVTVKETGFMPIAEAVVLVMEIVSFPVKVCGVDTVTVSVWVDPDG